MGTTDLKLHLLGRAGRSLVTGFDNMIEEAGPAATMQHTLLWRW